MSEQDFQQQVIDRLEKLTTDRLNPIGGVFIENEPLD